jgi:hypothetical protein
MFKRHTPTVDELLGDSLVQVVMRADNVEPQALRTLLEVAAGRIAAARGEGELRPVSAHFANPPIDRRPSPRAAVGPTRARHMSPPDPCGSALCC